MEIFCFFAGIVFFYSHSVYPLMLVIISLLLKARWVIVLWFIAALLWAYCHQLLQADFNMPAVKVIPQADVVGEVVSLPVTNAAKTQFQFLIGQLNQQPAKALVLLNCYQHCPVFAVGQVWHLQVKLKKPDNLANPGGFDYVSWLHARHMNWTGYLNHEAKLLHEPQTTNLTLIRSKMADLLASHITNEEILGVVQALTLGVTSHIDKSMWDLFRRTGTTHLMVISGAHIGLVAGLSLWLIKWLWRWSASLCLYFPAVQAGSIGGLLAALIYSLLAGFGVPAQRSLIACVLLLLSHLFSQRFSGWQSWRYGVLLVLLYEPHAVTLPGLYLSFLAVATLIISSQRLSCSGIKKTLGIQLACLLGLMPLTLYWFSYGAVDGLLANLLAIPLVGYVIVPLSLFTLPLLHIFPVTSLTLPVSWAVKLLLFYLGWVDKAAVINLRFSLTQINVVFALMLVMIILVVLPAKSLLPAALVLFLSCLFPYYPLPKVGQARIDILDVGQGLAVVVTTAHHNLIYDTGMKFYQGSDMGKLAVIPYLNARGIQRIDKIVISHPDLDHRGGLPSIEEAYEAGELIVDRVAFYQRGQSCHNYPDWQWDGIQFHFFAVQQGAVSKNNSSCVLRISNGLHSILLPGDVEKEAERYLVANYAQQLKSDVLVAAHHGSKTSSIPAFIEQVIPSYAIISAGFDNRYHFPHQQTLTTLARNQVSVINTIDCGMVTVNLDNRPILAKPSCYRH